MEDDDKPTPEQILFEALKAALVATPGAARCRQCGEPVESDREQWGTPVCHACVPQRR